jgi:chitinase
MNRRIAVAVLALAAASAFAGAAGAARTQSVRGAFFTNWSRYARGYTVRQIPADRLNLVDYAFAFPTAAGTCVSSDPWSDYQAPTWSGADSVDGIADDPADLNQHLFGNFNQLRKLKAAHPDLRLEISIGGWTGSTYFSDIAATAASRAAFVASCIDLFIKGNLPGGGWPEGAGGPGSAAGLFDGINIDWEYPGIDPGNGAHHTTADRANATLLLQEFRRQLDALGSQSRTHYLLTNDIPGGNVNSARSWQLRQVAQTVDWIDLMAFDFHGGWEPWTDFNSPLLRDPTAPPVGGGAIEPTWSTLGSVLFFMANGVPADKISLGIPFYGKEYVGVGPARHGLYQPHGPQPGNDSPSYHDLVDTGLADANLTPIGPTAAAANGRGINGFTRYVDLLAGSPWLYNPSLNGGTFISYVDPETVALRAALVRGLGLRGAWAWEISNDSNAHDLTNAMTGR